MVSATHAEHTHRTLHDRGHASSTQDALSCPLSDDLDPTLATPSLFLVRRAHAETESGMRGFQTVAVQLRQTHRRNAVKFTISHIAHALKPVLASLTEHAVEEDTLVGFNDNREAVVGDVGTQPIVAWVRPSRDNEEPCVEISLNPEVANRHL